MMKVIALKYSKETHGLAIELLERIVICLHYGIPGHWWFTEEFDGIKLYYPLGIVFGESDDGYHIGIYILIFMLHIRSIFMIGYHYLIIDYYKIYYRYYILLPLLYAL